MVVELSEAPDADHEDLVDDGGKGAGSAPLHLVARSWPIPFPFYCGGCRSDREEQVAWHTTRAHDQGPEQVKHSRRLAEEGSL